MIESPYLLFLGDAPDIATAKTAAGIRQWRGELCAGQLRLPGCRVDLGLPDLRLEPAGEAGFALAVGPGHPGFTPVFAGILRAMADDYGAFALVDLAGPAAPGVIHIDLLEAAFAEGRSFHLGRPEVA